MNCYNHPLEQAVAQCPECNKSLCLECASRYAQPICAQCRKKLAKGSIRSLLWTFFVFAGVFYLGYISNFAGLGKTENRWWNGYFLMAVVGGWSFLNLYVPYRLQRGSFALWGVYILFKTAVSLVLGLFVTPYIIVRNLIYLIRLLKK